MDKFEALGSAGQSNAILRLTVIALFAGASLAQAPQVRSWENSTDGVRTQITITASAGIRPAPILLLECSDEPKKHSSVEIYLITGDLRPHPTVGLLNSVSEWLLRTRLDDGKPVFLSWVPAKQPGTYSYEGEGKNGMASERKSPKEFLKDLLAAKVLDVEYQRRGDREMRLASFNTSQLKRSFDARPECVTQ